MQSLLVALGLCAVASAAPFYGFAPYAGGPAWGGFNPYFNRGGPFAPGPGPLSAAGPVPFQAAPAPFVGGYGRWGCGLEPAKPADTARCEWEAVQNAYGCVVDFECVPRAEAPPPPCPAAPARPETGAHCNWIPIQDKRGCIIDYECEPVTPAPCPPAPVKPDNGGRCKWTPIKDHKDCLIDWECEPLGPARFFPLAQAGLGGLPWFKK